MIHWNRDSFLIILHFVYDGVLDLTSDNFLHVLEVILTPSLNSALYIFNITTDSLQGALFFGVEGLVLECEAWLSKITTSDSHFKQISLVNVAEIWSFCIEHGEY